MNIESLRRLKGLNQSELADMAGITQPTISRAERGDDGVTLEKFKAIALALKVPLSDIFQENRSRGENELLELYRRLPTDRQRVWLQMATALAADQP